MVKLLISYTFIYILGIITGVCLTGLLSSARHNLDETQTAKRHRRHSSTPETFRPSMHDEAE